MTTRLCLALSLLGCCGAAAAAPNPRAALVIGNARYETAVGPLRNAVNDAKAISKALRGLGFAVTEEHNVTRDELLEEMAAFRRKAAGAEVALFYFAGHGISVGGSNYLLPVKSGYQPEGVDETTLRMLAETKLFNAEQAVADMSAAGARCNLVILDACRTTPVARNPRHRDAARAGGLAEMKPPAGSLIAFATDAGLTANDGEGSNGLYTEELLRHLRMPGLTIEQVFKRTRAAVLERSGGAQIPAEYSRLVGEDIYLAGPAPAATAGPPPEPPPLKAQPVPMPKLATIHQLAANGRTAECIEALRLMSAGRGPGDFAAQPLDTLLETAKENLKEVTGPCDQVTSAMQTCEAVLVAMADCLPDNHPKKPLLTAKAQNRRGDCLLILGRHTEALQAYQIAVPLAPDDAYPVYNRGRAYRALGRNDEAMADFTTAAATRFNQPKARQLALAALAEMKSAGE